MSRCVTLWVEVNEQYRSVRRGKCRGQVDRGGCLPHASFLIGYGHHSFHGDFVLRPTTETHPLQILCTERIEAPVRLFSAT